MLPNKPLDFSSHWWLNHWFHWVMNLTLLASLIHVGWLQGLPVRFQRSGRSKHERIQAIFESDDPELTESEAESDGGLGDPILHVEADQLEQDQELRMHIMGIQSYWTMMETNFAEHIKSLPCRWLPPSTVRMLWIQMDRKDISYAHFWRVFRQGWHQILRFLPESTHGSCDQCSWFKSRFKKRLTPQEKFECARAYRTHINEVSADRDLEEYLQSQDPLSTPGSPLCVHWVSCQLSSNLYGKHWRSNFTSRAHDLMDGWFWSCISDLNPFFTIKMGILPKQLRDTVGQYFYFDSDITWRFHRHWTFEDGMDQSKWRIPRYHGPNGQRPLKSTVNLQRPQLKVQGVWIHNVLLDLWDSWQFCVCASFDLAGLLFQNLCHTQRVHGDYILKYCGQLWTNQQHLGLQIVAWGLRPQSCCRQHYCAGVCFKIHRRCAPDLPRPWSAPARSNPGLGVSVYCLVFILLDPSDVCGTS